MGTRGRESTASLGIVKPDNGARPEPWPSLNKAEADYWRNIVQSLPPSWFRPSDMPLLAAYCKAAARHDEAAKRLDGEDPIDENVKSGVRKPNPNFAIIDRCISQMAQLAGKLRLCPSARYEKQVAGTAIKNAASGKKPWQAES